MAQTNESQEHFGMQTTHAPTPAQPLPAMRNASIENIKFAPIPLYNANEINVNSQIKDITPSINEIPAGTKKQFDELLASKIISPSSTNEPIELNEVEKNLLTEFESASKGLANYTLKDRITKLEQAHLFTQYAPEDVKADILRNLGVEEGELVAYNHIKQYLSTLNNSSEQAILNSAKTTGIDGRVFVDPKIISVFDKESGQYKYLVVESTYLGVRALKPIGVRRDNSLTVEEYLSIPREKKISEILIPKIDDVTRIPGVAHIGLTAKQLSSKSIEEIVASQADSENLTIALGPDNKVIIVPID
jgi:hypothetical protein